MNSSKVQIRRASRFRQNAKSRQNKTAAAAMGMNEKESRAVDWMINGHFGSFASAKNALITLPVFVFATD